MATESRHDSLNGVTPGEAPPLTAPCPVSRPHATVAATATPVVTNVHRQTGGTTGRRRVARSDWPIRMAQTLPTPTIASKAITM